MKGKAKVGFSIDSSINEEFTKWCDSGSINKSKLVNKLIKDFLEKEKNKIEHVENR